MSLRELAAAANVPVATLHRMESEGQRYTWRHLMNVFRVLQLRVVLLPSAYRITQVERCPEHEPAPTWEYVPSAAWGGWKVETGSHEPD